MTPWQTSLRRDSSAAEMVMPRFVAPNQRPDQVVVNQPPAVMQTALRTLFQQTMIACKWLQQKSAQKFSSRRMRVAETVALGEKRFVTILQVDGTQLLIGSAAGQVSLLAILDEHQAAWRAGSTPGQSA